MLSLGIDPGPVNTGLAVTSFTPEASGVVLTQKLNFTSMTPYEVKEAVLKLAGQPDILTIERFVTYRGVQSDASERTSILVGALATLLPQATLVRAIDWKTSVMHYLYTQGFRNPSSTLDKKFSLAAAEFSSGVRFKTDHEADAFLLSLYGYIKGIKHVR